MKTYIQFLNDKKEDLFFQKAYEALENKGLTVDLFLTEFFDEQGILVNEDFWQDYRNFWKELPGRVAGGFRGMLSNKEAGISYLKSAVKKLRQAGMENQVVKKLIDLIREVEQTFEKQMSGFTPMGAGANNTQQPAVNPMAAQMSKGTLPTGSSSTAVDPMAAQMSKGNLP